MADPDDLPPYVLERPLALAAARWALERHQGQRRSSDDAPFVLHPFEVGALLHGRGHADEIVAAGILHDVVEDTPARPEEIREHFGDAVADLVVALTDDASVTDPAARRAALREQIAAASRDAQTIFAADKVAKARELRAETMRNGLGLTHDALRDRYEHYLRSLEILDRADPPIPFADQLRFELWALRRLPPGPSPVSGV